MDKDEESKVFLVISDMQQNGYYKVHSLTIPHSRKEKTLNSKQKDKK